ncbi:hypothetical protein COV81_00800 [Candidatus Peregrinibacteria bacterium CG11_big_fil_rev_8_21_14_0_20_41_10]|nr:MAG: hypothetical protein COV81_00800 [Candidatus Peregrinibacteria bacterium CG11_big_fil_rev_8_21_14_0_20_41_10]PJC38041.1 MAG: hypothetical protein CO045_02395 [Candidatus Peregrinibacteria bacterium CG_4_9_14_0_2_um_filter_41_14]
MVERLGDQSPEYIADLTLEQRGLSEKLAALGINPDLVRQIIIERGGDIDEGMKLAHFLIYLAQNKAYQRKLIKMILES